MLIFGQRSCFLGTRQLVTRKVNFLGNLIIGKSIIGENDDALFEAATQMDEDQTNAGADYTPPGRSSLSKIESDAESDNSSIDLIASSQQPEDPSSKASSSRAEKNSSNQDIYKTEFYTMKSPPTEKSRENSRRKSVRMGKTSSQEAEIMDDYFDRRDLTSSDKSKQDKDGDITASTIDLNQSAADRTASTVDMNQSTKVRLFYR